MAERQRLLGWRVSLTNGRAPGHPLTAVGVVRLYRGPWSVERLFQHMRGRPMGMTPLYVRRDDHRKGLLRLFSLVARALTALAYQVRRGLAQSGRALAGLYEGAPKRQTQRPTTERLLRAFKGLHLVIGRWGGTGALACIPPLRGAETNPSPVGLPRGHLSEPWMPMSQTLLKNQRKMREMIHYFNSPLECHFNLCSHIEVRHSDRSFLSIPREIQ